MNEISAKERLSRDDNRTMWSRRDYWLGVLMLVGATFYRPLTFWAENAWDLAAPQDVLVIGALQLTGAVALLSVGCSTLTLRPISLGLLLSAVFVIIFNWHTIGGTAPAFWLAIVVLGVLALDHFASPLTLNGVALVSIAVLLVAPFVQLAYGHFDQRVSYPITRSEPVVGATPTGNVEDVLVLIVDAYPMPAVAEGWFGHDTSRLTEGLASQGFRTSAISWSQNTFTRLAVPSMMELRQVIDHEPIGTWGNVKDSYDVARGESLVVSAFQSAGFKYTHLESGWNGGVCRTADRCIEAPWYGGARSLVLSSSIISYPLTKAFGVPFVATSIATIDNLVELDVFEDGQLDYVYAHSLLPHGPFLVDETCSVRDLALDGPSRTERIRQQLGCADEFVLEVVTSIPQGTAVLIAADHGTATNGQLAKPEADWEDSDIAERLGALLAYRIPPACDVAEATTNVSAMRAIATCALKVPIPEQRGGFVIGEGSPLEVQPARVASIEEKLRSGTLTPPDLRSLRHG